MDVKPFNTFINRVAVNPETRHITFNNVPDFLEVNYILSKQTTIYRIVFPIVAEITRVERLPLVQQIDSYGYEKILGDTGKGQVWYEFEVRQRVHMAPCRQLITFYRCSTQLMTLFSKRIKLCKLENLLLGQVIVSLKALKMSTPSLSTFVPC